MVWYFVFALGSDCRRGGDGLVRINIARGEGIIRMLCVTGSTFKVRSEGERRVVGRRKMICVVLFDVKDAFEILI